MPDPVKFTIQTRADVNSRGPLAGQPGAWLRGPVLTYNPSRHTLTVTVSASGLTPGPHAAHIHQGSSATILSNGQPTIFFRPLLCADIH